MDRHLSDEKLDQLMGRYLVDRHTEIVATARPDAEVARIGRTHLAGPTGQLRGLGTERPGRQLVVVLILAALAALVAGAVLVGSSLDSLRPDPLRGLVTEEVEPGVLHVVNDGFRDLAAPIPQAEYAFFGFDIAAGYDGRVWEFSPDGFFRLGDPGTFGWGDQPLPDLFGYFEVTPDGTLWRADAVDGLEGPGRLWWFDGTSWTDSQRPGGVYGLDVQPDGTVWAAWGSSVGRFDGELWTVDAVPGGDGGGDWLSVADDGTVWVAGDAIHSRAPGRAWEGQTWPLGQIGGTGRRFDAGPDGTVWTYLQRATLGMFEGTDWTTYGGADGVPSLKFSDISSTRIEAAPDGSVWVQPSGTGGVGSCGGLANFDRVRWKRYLDGTCVFGFDVAPDGAVWLQGSSGFTGPAETYVITGSAMD